MSQELYRTLSLLKHRYFTLATTDVDGSWSTPLNHVLDIDDSISLLFYSSPESRHSQALKENHQVSGSIFTVAQHDEIDGLQFEGSGYEVPTEEIAAVHQFYYEKNFPEPQVRSEWLIPIEEFSNGGSHRFYRIHLDRVWIIDIAGWDADKVDKRLEVQIKDLLAGA